MTTTPTPPRCLICDAAEVALVPGPDGDPECADADACFARLQRQARAALTAECAARGLPAPDF